MKLIKTTELKEGDIFTFELKLRGREAFIVEERQNEKLICKSRLTGNGKTITKKMNCILLKTSES